MHETNVLLQVAAAIVAATAFAFLAKWLRQPLLLGYIAAGILIGPTEGLGIIDPEAIAPIAELGLILLLFMIGLEIDLKKLQGAGRAVIAAGAVQFPACVILGLLVLPLLGWHNAGGGYAALYLAVAAALSSTMIVVKLLYDKRELDTVTGRITLGVLVFQDVWAILFLAIQPDLHAPDPWVILASLAKAGGLIMFALSVSRFLLPALFRFIAKVPELMVMGALGWCFVVALLASALDLSLEMGALIAGVALSTFPYNLDVIAKVISLRDFFITLFFVTLGSRVPRPTGAVLGAAVALSLFLVATRFLSLTPLLHRLRVGNRASIIPAINLSQISEFSLVICSIGLALGHITDQALAVVVYTLVLTSVASTYAIQYNHEMFDRINPLLVRLGFRDLDVDTGEYRIELPDRRLLFVGFHRHASSVLHRLLEANISLRDAIGVIDFNPHVKAGLDRLGVANIYGDVSHLDTLHHAGVHHADVLLVTIPDALLRGTSNRRMLKQLRDLAPHARVIVTADELHEAQALYDAGAAFVYVPRLMSAATLADAVVAALDADPVGPRTAALAQLAAHRTEVLA